MKCPDLHPLIQKACSDLLPQDSQCVCIIDALSREDSSCMTAGVGAYTNSPTNMRPLGDKGYVPSSQVKRLYGWYASYEKPEDGIVNAVALYGKLYAGMEADAMVRKWANTNPERNPSYFDSVRSCFP